MSNTTEISNYALKTMLELCYGFGAEKGELKMKNRLLEGDVRRLEEVVENLKTENAALRKKYEKREGA